MAGKQQKANVLTVAQVCLKYWGSRKIIKANLNNALKVNCYGKEKLR